MQQLELLLCQEITVLSIGIYSTVLMMQWDDMGFVCASKYRRDIVRILLRHSSTPKRISENTKIKMPHISRTLGELAQRDIVKCLTPERLKGKIFALTEKGLEIANRIENDVN